MSDNRQEDILIVDDNLTNVELLKKVLLERGYKVRAATNGQTALMLSRAKQPDLILLDIQMLGMNGYETCQELKKDEKTKDIPIIFISALNEVFDKVKGFRSGAVDYITKPIEIEEVLARVATHLQIQRLQNDLRRKNAQLEAMNHEKDELMGIVAHDIRNPLAVILMSVGITARELAGSKLEKSIDRLDHVKTSVKRINSILNSLLDVNKIESGDFTLIKKPIALIPKIESVIVEHHPFLEAKNLTLKKEIPSRLSLVLADANLLNQVLANLLSNAIKYSPERSTITIRLKETDIHVSIEIEDQGLGLTDDDKTKLFGKFMRLSAKPTGGEDSVGLGLYIVKKLVDGMDGKIWAKSEGKEKGSTFILEFPKSNPV